MNLWAWFEQYRRDHAGDGERARLVEIYSEAFAVRETQPSRAVALVEEGGKLAERLAEPCWRVLYEKFRIDALMHFQRDFREVLEPAWQITQDLASPALAEFPEPYAVADTLLVAYLGIDPLGYAETFRETLTPWEAKVPDEPCLSRYLLLARRRQLAMEQNRAEDAEELIERELELASHDPDADQAMHFSLFAFMARCQMAQLRGDDDGLAHAATRAGELAARCGYLCEEAEALAWMALLARREGREEQAQATHQEALGRLQHLGIIPSPGYFNALTSFHEEIGQFDKSLDMRLRELTAIRERNRRMYECRVRLEVCRLLDQLHRPAAEEIEQALTAAGRLRHPETFVEELGRFRKAG